MIQGNELRNYSGCLQGKPAHKENISMGKYKVTTKVSKHTGKKHNSATNSNHRNQQAHTKNSTNAIPVLVNGLTSVHASTKNLYHKPKSSFQQDKEHKIIIIGNSHAQVSAGNVKHNLNGNYRSSGFVRPGANIDTPTSSVMEDIKHLTNNDTTVFWQTLKYIISILGLNGTCINQYPTCQHTRKEHTILGSKRTIACLRK